jgi:hypothetical protein
VITDLVVSMDDRFLCVTNSLYSTWDNQFYPGLRSWLLRVRGCLRRTRGILVARGRGSASTPNAISAEAPGERGPP